MPQYAFFQIPDFPIFSMIMHSFIKTTVNALPILEAKCRFHDRRLYVVEWHWRQVSGDEDYERLLKVLNTAYTEKDQGRSYILIFRSYIQSLLDSITMFLTNQNFFENQYQANQLFSLEIDIKIFRHQANYFHFDGGNEGGDIDILGFAYVMAKTFSTVPRTVNKNDMTFVVHQDRIEPRTVMTKALELALEQDTITYGTEMREDHILFFNNHNYLHSSPTAIEMDIIEGSRIKGSRTALVRFSLTKLNETE